MCSVHCCVYGLFHLLVHNIPSRLAALPFWLPLEGGEEKRGTVKGRKLGICIAWPREHVLFTTLSFSHGGNQHRRNLAGQQAEQPWREVIQIKWNFLPSSLGASTLSIFSLLPASHLQILYKMLNSYQGLLWKRNCLK